MHFKVKKLTAVLTACIISVLTSVSSVNAYETYSVYNYDRWGEAVPSQAGYTARKSVTGDDLGAGSFNMPGDIFIDTNGRFYIADTGNSRIVVTDDQLNSADSVLDTFTYNSQELTLKNPKGIYVSPDNMIYIADTENSRVLVCDQNCKVKLILERPQSDLYPENLTFLPQKVISDRAGYIYVTVANITSGALMYDKDGNFEGFYGANRVKKTSQVVMDYFWKLLAPDSMRKYMTDAVPAPVTNFDIDSDGFIYTCCSSRKQDTDVIKKVNTAGYNLFADYDISFGDYPTPDYSNTPQNSFVDVDVSDDGLINCLDFTNGRIFQYDEECNLLFVMGSLGNQTGTFTQVSAVESSDSSIYVADAQKNTITVFDETVFGSYVHKAVRLYNDGYYDEALKPWNEVLRMDGGYCLASNGIASALINKGEYKKAMKYAKAADNQWLYNRAFEGWRTEFINSNFSAVAAVLAGIILIISAPVYLKKRKKRLHKSEMEEQS
ncbi:MAG: hypothetical protein Q4F95_04620 [Oscillospiraceae bacterium]|nr:hypothetical protein [Oscillospiraceae bacterium]